MAWREHMNESTGQVWNGPLRRLVAGHFLAAAAEWALYIGAFVYAFQRGGSAGTGVASILLLASTVIASPLGGQLAARLQPNVARLGSLLGQAAGLIVAGVAALADGPLWIVLAGSVITLSLFRVLRPAQAVLAPLLCEHPRQLSTTNLWIGHADSSAALFGPLLSTVLLSVGGPGALLLGFGIALGVASVLQAVDRGRGISERKAVTHDARLASVVVEPFRQLRSRGGLLSLVGLITLQYGLVGALDILFVVISLETLGLEATSSSLLTTSFGVGAVGAVVLSTLAHKSNRLALALSGGLVVCGVVIGALAWLLTSPMATITPLFLGLPVLGAARFVVVVVSRALLQRSADDDTIGSVFALQELGSGLGILAGSVVAQLTLFASGPALTLAVFSTVYVAVAALTWRSVHLAESSATVPLVEMGVLRKVPAFAPLPPFALESVARQAELVDVDAQDVVVRQGDTGMQFFVVVSGECDVVMDDEYVRTASRGDSFGEVALLANVARTATVCATNASTLLVIAREPFLRALSSDDTAATQMWHAVADMDFGHQFVEIPTLDNPAGGAKGVGT